MERALLSYLKSWLIASDRKPLVIRGPRQVGKTWLIRHLAKISGKQIIELNFEKQPAHISFFSSNDPQSILLNLSTLTPEKIVPENCILFLDEIQTVPELLAKLRWFYESLPQLPVVAAGSLLEFVLAEHSFSMPVGRINYVHLEPLSFEEFLWAKEKKSLYNYLVEFDLNREMPRAIHEQLLTLFKEYIFIGGLPAVVASWITDHSLPKVNQLQNDLLSTYRDDFAKYQGRIARERIEEVLLSTPKMLGQKFIYSNVNASVQSSTIKQILTLLERARICHRVRSVSGNGVPLAAEVKEKYFKEIFLDTGLANAVLGLSLHQINAVNEITMIHSGGITEQVIGQILRTIAPPYIEPALYCWHREESSSNAEIDYLIQHGNQVIPIEVKSGATGSLKSLHLYMGLKKTPLALRINSQLPNKTNVDVKNSIGEPAKYLLLSIPFYLTGQIHRLLESEFSVHP